MAATPARLAVTTAVLGAGLLAASAVPAMAVPSPLTGTPGAGLTSALVNGLGAGVTSPPATAHAVTATAKAATTATTGKAVHLSNASRAAAAAKAYPFAVANPDAVDPWGAFNRQCTSFASWYLAHTGIAVSGSDVLTGPKGSRALGNAAHWDVTARAVGYRVLSKPQVGAVAQWEAGEGTRWSYRGRVSSLRAGSEGHVGIVRKVLPGGLAVIDDYNSHAPLGFSEYVGKAPRYLLITPHITS